MAKYTDYINGVRARWSYTKTKEDSTFVSYRFHILIEWNAEHQAGTYGASLLIQYQDENIFGRTTSVSINATQSSDSYSYSSEVIHIQKNHQTSKELTCTISLRAGAANYPETDTFIISAGDLSPTCTRTVTSQGPYYTNGSTGTTNRSIYSVKISNVKTYDANFYSVALNVGTKVASSTNTSDTLAVSWGSNDVSVGNPLTLTPTLTITDTAGRSKTYTLTNITVTNHRAPVLTSCTYEGINLYNNKYYKDYSGYKVTLQQFSLYDNTSGTATLTVGNQTISSAATVNGVVTINPLNAVYNSVTPSIVITDSLGASTSQNLSAIQIYDNQVPTCTATPAAAPSGGYVATMSGRPYTVNITNASGKNGKAIASIVLSFDGQTASRTNNGSLSIVPYSAKSTVVPAVTITDALGKSSSYSLAAVTVNPNTAPTIDSTKINWNTNSVLYANTPTPGSACTNYIVTINNSNSGAIQTSYEKTITEVKLIFDTLSQSKTSNFNTSFSLAAHPIVAKTVVPSIEITDNGGAKATVRCPSNITVNALQMQVSINNTSRVDSAGKLDDEDTNAVIQATFNYSSYTGNYLLEPTFSDTASSGDTSIIWYANWNKASGFSNPVSWTNYSPSSPITLYGFVQNTNSYAVDKSYSMTITPKSTALNGAAVSSTLAPTFYLLVGKEGGRALGIGKKPSADNMLDINMYTKTNNSIDAGTYVTNTGQSQEFVIQLGGGAGTISMYSEQLTSGNRGIRGINYLGNSVNILEVNQNNAVSLYGIYTFNGGQQPPDFFGTNRVGFLMSNATINGNSNYKNWIYMDCYNGNDVGGTTAFGIDRNTGRAFVMRADANRTSWNTTGELYSTLYKPTAADVSAIALSDKYTRSSAGGLDWSNQTDGDAKIITKSALAFWNGSYDGSTSNLTRFKASNGTSYSFGTLASKNSLSASDVGALPADYFIFDTYSKSITVGQGATNITVGTLTQHSGYTLRGYINQNGGYTDQWLVSYGTYGSNVVAMVYSKYNGSLTQTISCTAVWTKN